jgi:molybdopterin converting factor small subunit
VADLVKELRGRGPPFDRLPAEPAVAVNRTYALLSEPLGSGDEVAFIPPVAGG